MSAIVRTRVTAVAAAVLGVALVVAAFDLPSATTAVAYGIALAEVGFEDRRALNAVSTVLFDQRPSDTLGEALALFVASAGLQLVLRPLSGERLRPVPRMSRSTRPSLPTSDTVRAITLGLVTPTAALAVYVSLRGHLGIGGGLQGGALAATALALLFLAGRYRAQRTLTPEALLDAGESISIGGYLVVGLAGLVVGASFLENVLPLGSFGALASSGTIVVLSVLVAVEAAAAVVLVLSEIQEEPYESEGGP